MSGELQDAVRLLAGALRAAGQELEALAHTEIAEPDVLEKVLREHAAMKATLGVFRQGLQGEQRQALLTAYQNEARRATPTHVALGTYPVLSDVRREVDDAVEAVRRLAITCPEVREALDGTDVWERAPAESGA